MKLSLQNILNPTVCSDLQKLGYQLPKFDIQNVKNKTQTNCNWVHFGCGNIFRAFIAARMQDLLDKGLADTGIVVGEGFDGEMIEQGYDKYDNLCVNVTLKGNGQVEKSILASVTEAYICNPARKEWQRFVEIFRNPALQIVSFTITEKGYSVTPDYVQKDILLGPDKCSTICCMVAALLYERFKSCATPVAVVSMDNCSKNGEKLGNGIKAIADKWLDLGFVSKEYVSWLNDDNKVSFPWTMIDKITPRPDESVKVILEKDGLENMDITVTSKRSYVSPFVNAEECEYLVVEDKFPNGRPCLEKAGIYFTNQETVTKVERMKVCTCLNPLHTAMTMMGCLLGYTKISDEMKDEDIPKYIQILGYIEGLPVVTNPGIIEPKKFIDDVFTKRLPNPFMPDTPQRIATDTSQKLAIRFGETYKEYKAKGLDVNTLKVLPMVLASFVRYLMGIDDSGKEFELSPDPMVETLQNDIKTVKYGEKLKGGELDEILSRVEVWGYDLGKSELRDTVIEDFEKLNAGPGSVRKTLHDIVTKKTK